MSFSYLLLRNLPSDRSRDTDRQTGCQQNRSRSRSRDREGETNPKPKRKRVSRWSDHPPSPRRDDDNNSGSNNKNDNRDSNCLRDRLVDRPPPEEPVVGDIYNGKISSIMQFGCFVQLEGLRSVTEMVSLQPCTPTHVLKTSCFDV